jgi:hypothetical protein
MDKDNDTDDRPMEKTKMIMDGDADDNFGMKGIKINKDEDTRDMSSDNNESSKSFMTNVSNAPLKPK